MTRRGGEWTSGLEPTLVRPEMFPLHGKEKLESRSRHGFIKTAKMEKRNRDFTEGELLGRS